MNYIKQNQKQAYIAAGVIILIILALVLFIGGDNNEEGLENDTATTTVGTNTPTSPAPSGNSSAVVPNTDNPNSSQIVENPTPKPVPVILSEAKLDGALIRLISYNGNPVSADGKYTLSFDKGKLSAKFCNSLSGNFVLDGNSIRVTNFIGTQMYCAVPAGLMEMETNLVSMLDSGATIYQSGDTIILSHSAKGVVMVFTGFTNQ